MARGCICGKARLGRMFVTDGTCWWCGHGTPADPPGKHAQRRRRLPWDLGSLQREGRRADPHLENVVRFDKLTSPRSFLGPVELEDGPHECAHCGGHFDQVVGRQLYCTPECREAGSKVVAWGRAA